ncbi:MULTISPECIES: F0F1 ATP synthase subunit delta [Halomonadaceae]|jgi:F-type H+-transporting ATPase subunit delta|uniref:ATP synthase subunit delta n=2 Tax=Halomonadaceae TaxID=28256 RepID=A0AAP9ZM28_9GAMM|nr:MULTISPECIES: F0F1 ATP synthase subunit delta [Halomonas]MBR9924819.1 F0F1 ATP synthase subunit delta [Gammaproteobacteria bacterium]AZM97842.1 F0F1 ATP synthase subunit delta [Halomonas venusta]MDW0360943.1 F0F1 ATP synthase subunit delta [Halomonas venusta]MDX1354746.1 F0F1 ATP synthase subunit delta [Halomonas venusta]MDX1712864.1 F0F1 ATP synthase subunit delta [Halomonas venusta]
MAELLTVARPYAKAAFEYARDHKALDSWTQALSFLSAAVADSDLRRLLGSPKLENDKKVALLSDMLPEKQEDLSRFLDTLADQGRLLALPFIAEQFEYLRAEHEQRVDVTVTSAYKLTAAQQTKLANALKKRLNREISITTQVDKTLIGGVILRAGDTVIDGSVRGRLNRLSEALTA